MASSIIDIQTIYGTMLTELVRDPDTWISFLNCAGMNYKYNFNEQLLIYSQKPSAIACAETKFWNEKMHRWVRKGSKGIALFDSSKKSGLRYVFDVSDTTDYYNRKLKLWEVKLDYENEIIESLEANYGTLENKDDFAGAILSAINNSIEDNIQDYFDILIENTYGTNLANMDELTIQMEYKSLLINSVAYMVLTRTGLNPFDYIKREDFYYVQNFNSFNSIVTLGAATSDISEHILRNIEVSVRNIQKNKNRTFVLNKSNDYNVEKSKGRINNYERKIGDNIQTRRRLFDTEYSSADTEDSSREIRENENEIFEREQESNVSIISNAKSIEQSFDRDTEISTGENRQLDRENENTGEYNRRIESYKSNGLGRSNEQYQEQSRRDSDTGIDLQLNLFSEEEQKQKIADIQTKDVSAIFEFTQEMRDKTQAEDYRNIEKNYKLSNGNYFHFHTNEEGYYYSIYDKYGVEQDGGLLEYSDKEENQTITNIRERLAEFTDIEDLKNEDLEEVTQDFIDELENQEVFLNEEDNSITIINKSTNNANNSNSEQEKINYRIDNELLGVGTPREKFERNINAIRILKKCEEEKRLATPEEQEVLSQYIGWGGLADAFDENNISWSKEYNELKELLTDDEYEIARESTLTSFYTPPIVIESIYQALENMGLKNGNLLEPSCRN